MTQKRASSLPTTPKRSTLTRTPTTPEDKRRTITLTLEASKLLQITHPQHPSSPPTHSSPKSARSEAQRKEDIGHVLAEFGTYWTNTNELPSINTLRTMCHSIIDNDLHASTAICNLFHSMRDQKEFCDPNEGANGPSPSNITNWAKRHSNVDDARMQAFFIALFRKIKESSSLHYDSISTSQSTRFKLIGGAPTPDDFEVSEEDEEAGDLEEYTEKSIPGKPCYSYVAIDLQDLASILAVANSKPEFYKRFCGCRVIFLQTLGGFPDLELPLSDLC